MNKKLTGLALAAGFLTMGVGMPSCPGQQAMQQQVDQLTTTNADLNRKVQAMDAQVHNLKGDMEQVKNLLTQMTNAITQQRTFLDQVTAQIGELQKRAASAPAAAKGKKRR